MAEHGSGSYPAVELSALHLRLPALAAPRAFADAVARELAAPMTGDGLEGHIGSVTVNLRVAPGETPSPSRIAGAIRAAVLGAARGPVPEAVDPGGQV